MKVSRQNTVCTYVSFFVNFFLVKFGPCSLSLSTCESKIVSFYEQMGEQILPKGVHRSSFMSVKTILFFINLRRDLHDLCYYVRASGSTNEELFFLCGPPTIAQNEKSSKTCQMHTLSMDTIPVFYTISSRNAYFSCSPFFYVNSTGIVQRMCRNQKVHFYFWICPMQKGSSSDCRSQCSIEPGLPTFLKHWFLMGCGWALVQF